MQMSAAEVAAEAQEVANLFVISPAMPFSEHGVHETMTRLASHPNRETFTALQVRFVVNPYGIAYVLHDRHACCNRSE